MGTDGYQPLSYLKVEGNILGSFFKGGEGTTEGNVMSSSFPHLFLIQLLISYLPLPQMSTVSFAFDVLPLDLRTYSGFAKYFFCLNSESKVVQQNFFHIWHPLLTLDCYLNISYSFPLVEMYQKSVPLQVLLFLLIWARNSSCWLCSKQSNDVTQYLHCC